MRLTPYVPRLVLQWAADHPDERYRRIGGSLAFCDLSGFTAMSEKLAALGRLGAEELAEVLNLIFAALLDDAAAFGGSLLKYGGDAVLLFFEGDDHARRAAAATRRMRASLRRVGTVKTSKGTVRVRMSVGIHSGEFDFFLVGDSHRELIVAGPGATTTCAMETEADAGQILLSASTAGALPASSVGEAKGDGFLLRRAPRAVANDPEAWGSVPDADPVPFIPVGLRSHIGGVGADAEHRHVAVGFVAFGGVDDLLAREGGERTANVLDDFIRACQAAFDRFDVCFLYADVYGDGGKVFFLSGAPVSHEDNEERLLRAALEISSIHREGLHLHTGLNRGYVFAGDIGAEFRRTYTVLGDAVNTAARVMASCNEEGQVRAMPEVLDLATSRFEVVPQTPFAAKGKALPLSTLAVGEALGPRLSDAPLPLIGRDEEMATLRRRLDEAEAGDGGVLHIAGVAGVGKSRLAEELRGEAEGRGFATMTTHAERFEQTTVYYVLRQLLTVIFDDAVRDANALLSRASELAPAAAEWFPLLGPVLGLDIAATASSAALDSDTAPPLFGRLIVALLDGFLDGPSLWVMENAHFIDEASAKVISAVAGQLTLRPWLLVVVQRAGDDLARSDRAIGGPADTVVNVESLSADDAVRLVRVAAASLLPSAAAAIAERADGNPLFLRQLVAATASGGELSDSVETAVSARIDRLAPTDRDVLRTASVLGGRFGTGDLRELLDGRTPDLARLTDFVNAVDDGTYAFRQTLYREVAYAGLTFRRRRALHLAAGRLLENDDVDDTKQLSRLSLHFSAAQAWDKAWRYARAAAVQADDFGSKNVAASFFVGALDAGRRLPTVSKDELAHVAAELGQAQFHAGRIADALGSYRLGRRLAAKNSIVRATLEFREGVVYQDTGDAARATRWLRRGLKTLDDSAVDIATAPAVELAVSLMVTLADACLRRGAIGEAQGLADRATRLATGSGETLLLGRSHQLGLMLAFAVGDLEAALQSGRAAVAALRQHPDFAGTLAVQLMNVGAISQLLGDWDAASASLQEAFTIQRARDNDAGAAATQVNLAELYLNQGRWAAASELLDDAEAVAIGIDPETAAYARALRARLHVRTGRDVDAADLESTDTVSLPDLIQAVAVEAALNRGDIAAARAALTAGEELDIQPVHALRAAVAERVTDDDVKAAAAAGNDFDVVLLRVMLGTDLDTDEDAQRLGIVDVPRWVRQMASKT